MESFFNTSVFERSVLAEEFVANTIIRLVKRKRHSVIGLATGKTMVGIYKLLVDEENKTPGLFENVSFVQLDEILLGNDKTGIFASELENLLIKPLKDRFKVFISINALSANANSEVIRYSQLLIDIGGIDLQLLGLGTNGHIGFNEPGCTDQTVCRVVNLDPETVSNANLPVGCRAITLGVRDILDSKKIILVASGIHKSRAVKSTFRGVERPSCPSSFLLKHKSIKIILDAPAASLLF